MSDLKITSAADALDRKVSKTKDAELHVPPPAVGVPDVAGLIVELVESERFSAFVNPLGKRAATELAALQGQVDDLRLRNQELVIKYEARLHTGNQQAAQIKELLEWAEEAADLLAQDYTGAYVVRATRLGLDYEKIKERTK